MVNGVFNIHHGTSIVSPYVKAKVVDGKLVKLLIEQPAPNLTSLHVFQQDLTKAIILIETEIDYQRKKGHAQ